jgi:hypothetical protein
VLLHARSRPSAAHTPPPRLAAGFSRLQCKASNIVPMRIRPGFPFAHAALLPLVLWGAAAADPIHASADGAHWHHDSGWLFPERLGEFTRVGHAQDVAGSRDAVAYYARVADGVRTVASVDVYPDESAAELASLEAASAAIERDLPPGFERADEPGVALGGAAPRDLVRVTWRYTRAATDALDTLYLAAVGSWRVRIRITVPRATPGAVALGEDFVRAQRWEALGAD